MKWLNQPLWSYLYGLRAKYKSDVDLALGLNKAKRSNWEGLHQVIRSWSLAQYRLHSYETKMSSKRHVVQRALYFAKFIWFALWWTLSY